LPLRRIGRLTAIIARTGVAVNWSSNSAIGERSPSAWKPHPPRLAVGAFFFFRLAAATTDPASADPIASAQEYLMELGLIAGVLLAAPLPVPGMGLVLVLPWLLIRRATTGYY
jgi:hypothetical protein